MTKMMVCPGNPGDPVCNGCPPGRPHEYLAECCLQTGEECAACVPVEQPEMLTVPLADLGEIVQTPVGPVVRVADEPPEPVDLDAIRHAVEWCDIPISRSTILMMCDEIERLRREHDKLASAVRALLYGVDPFAAVWDVKAALGEVRE